MKIIISFIFIFLPLLSYSQSIEDQVTEIGNELMCPVCQGQSVAESNSGLAKDMRAIIKQKLEQGETKEQIIDYFISRYGDSILGAPPAKGMGYILWLLPFLSLCVGVFIIYRAISSFQKPAESSEILDNQNSEYLEKIEKELDEN
ncbi:MAG: cytochrome c-type biogenesis protein CcmH [Candidatus Dadabacteria bacterium]|nr:cytochrome c-type biogenesis protein CcmH [Candidatus Dadabacteria bacterium]NIQ16360.1 cytochrome c-type biogenesis protein CcmH [Candidatus Dadabacteria bacterium]